MSSPGRSPHRKRRRHHRRHGHADDRNDDNGYAPRTANVGGVQRIKVHLLRQQEFKFGFDCNDDTVFRFSRRGFRKLAHIAGDGVEEPRVCSYALSAEHCTNATESAFLVVKLAKSERWRLRLSHEARVHAFMTGVQAARQFDSPAHIVPLLHAVGGVQYRAIALALPYCAHGSLAELIARDSERLTARRVSRWMALAHEAFRFLHVHCQMTHGDSHTGNWLIASEQESRALGVASLSCMSVRSDDAATQTVASFSTLSSEDIVPEEEERLLLFDFDESWPRGEYVDDANFRLMACIDEANFLSDLCDELSAAERDDLVEVVERHCRKLFIDNAAQLTFPPAHTMLMAGHSAALGDVPRRASPAYDVAELRDYFDDAKLLNANELRSWLVSHLKGLVETDVDDRYDLPMRSGGVQFVVDETGEDDDEEEEGEEDEDEDDEDEEENSDANEDDRHAHESIDDSYDEEDEAANGDRPDGSLAQKLSSYFF